MGGSNGKENKVIQPSLAGLEAEKPQESEFANCLVVSAPEYKDTGKRQEWTCSLYAQPSIFQPDIDMELTASARDRLARLSKRKNLKPGDRVVLTGIVRSDTLTFPTGETRTINRLALTQEPVMLVKEKRVSTTVYEQRNKLR